MKRYLNLFLIILSLNSNAQSIDWELISDDDGISIYRAKNHHGPLIPVKGEVIINHSAEEVLLVLNDISKRKDWIKRLLTAQTVKYFSLFDRIEYAAMDVPWPFKDRDFVIRVKTTIQDQGKVITLNSTSADEFRPATSTFVRAYLDRGFLRLTRLGKKRVKIESQAFGDPKGYVPHWLINLFQAKITRISVQRLIFQISKNLYSQKKIEDIERILKEEYEKTK